MGEGNVRWGIERNKHGYKGTWSFGMCLSRSDDEIYIYINFGRHNLSIGKFLQEIKEEAA